MEVFRLIVVIFLKNVTSPRYYECICKISHVPPRGAQPSKKGSLKSRLFWTFSILVLFLFLAAIPLYGINSDQAQYFKTLELLLGAKIGKLMTLGIGPIVTASIVLQLFKGAGILKLETSSEHGRFVYNGTHKLLTFLLSLPKELCMLLLGP